MGADPDFLLTHQLLEDGTRFSHFSKSGGGGNGERV